MELLGDVGHVESRFSRLETVLVSAQDRCRFVPNIPYAQKLFWMHPMVLLGEEA